MRVVVADRDLAFLEIVKNYLHRCGHEAEIATNGLECLKFLREFQPDVVVLDSSLLWGGFDGVLAEIQDEPMLRRTSTILVSEAPPDDSFILGASIGCYLRKPFGLKELVHKVETVRMPILNSSVRATCENV